MNQIALLDQLFAGNREQAAELILDTYNKKGYALVNYLYFANAMKWKLFDQRDEKRERSKETVSVQYRQALEESDILLPDGIAIEMFYTWFSDSGLSGKALTNLNGTDFLPYMLKRLKENGVKAEIILFGTKEEYIDQVGIHYAQYFPVLTAQHGYQEFDRTVLPPRQEGVVRLLLVGRGSPLQELWVRENTELIKKYECLVMNQGGTFEFAIGAETRAPERMIKARVLETFWRIATNPKKNLRKFLDMFGVVGFMWRRTMRTIFTAK